VVQIKEKIKKGTFSGVIPMMGLFVMAALMGFQSIPIGQAVSEELTDSFSDLGRMAETKSYADLYFFNFVPNGATHSINEMTYEHGQKGGNISWRYNDFSAGNAVNSKINDVIKGALQPGVRNYFNEKYGGTSQRGGCSIPEINYTTKVLPTTKGDVNKKQVDFYKNNIPVLIRSEVPSTGEPAPIQANCIDSKGDTRYVGDSGQTGSAPSGGSGSGGSGGSGGSSGSGIFSTIVDQVASAASSLNPWSGGSDTSLGDIEPLVFDDFTSAGYTSQINATGNRYHRMTASTAVFFNQLHNEWTNVEERTGSSSWTCSLGYSDYQEAVSQAENSVAGQISAGKSDAENSLSLPDGIEIKESTITSSDELKYDVTASNFEGQTHTWSSSGSCVCDCGKKCCYDEKMAHARVTPKSSNLRFTLEDTKYKILTEDTWENLEFTVDTYYHNYQYD